MTIALVSRFEQNFLEDNVDSVLISSVFSLDQSKLETLRFPDP